MIGNADYANGALRNPVNDARAVASKLETLGFKVILRENLNREGLHQSIGEFSKLLKEGGVGLFYYAGHGMQIKGRNFLIPVDADIQHEDDVEFRGMDANLVLSRMDSAHTRVNLIVLDACRNNPFSRATRSGNLGLAQMEAPKGTLIAFSTAPGSLAKDGAGTNSVYTRHLVEKLSLPGLPVEQVFKEVRIAVTKETNDRQVPWESSSLMGDFYFVRPDPAFKPKWAQVASIEKPKTGNTVPPSKTAEVNFQVVLSPVPQENKPAKAAHTGHDSNREGNELEVKVSNNVKKETSDDPRKELANSGIQWTEERFKESLVSCDLKTAKLFVQGGMRPNLYAGVSQNYFIRLVHDTQPKCRLALFNFLSENELVQITRKFKIYTAGNFEHPEGELPWPQVQKLTETTSGMERYKQMQRIIDALPPLLKEDQTAINKARESQPYLTGTPSYLAETGLLPLAMWEGDENLANFFIAHGTDCNEKYLLDASYPTAPTYSPVSEAMRLNKGTKPNYMKGCK